MEFDLVLTRKNLKVYLVLRTGFEPSTFGSLAQRPNHSANPSPQIYNLIICIYSLITMIKCTPTSIGLCLVESI